MIAALLLSMVAQVGPNPAPLDLEPLPIPRGKPSDVPAPVDPVVDPASAARSGAIAGNRAIIAGEYEAAVHLLGEARSAAVEAGQARMAAEIGLDRARALMMLQRHHQAESELSVVRETLPGDAHAWVVSSVNARRLGNRAKAQALIAEALAFAPDDPGVGLEAGTLAYLVGDRDGALGYWRAVVENSADSAEAQIARQFIESLEAEDAAGERETE